MDEHGEEAVYKWFHSQLRCKQQIRLCQNVGGGACREMNRYFKLLNFHNYDGAL